MSEEGVERRLTTILAADVVGYSRLMAADEAGRSRSSRPIAKSLSSLKPRNTTGVWSSSWATVL